MAVMLGIPVGSSTVYSGFCGLERHVGICHQNMETGKMYAAVLPVARQKNIGDNFGIDQWCRFLVADDRC